MPKISAHSATPRKRCFDPVVDQRTRVLLLGSLPGERSLAQQQYYGNPQNRFWLLMSGVIGCDLVPLDYAARLRTLQEHGIGLWDVVSEAERQGSLDNQIRGQVANDLVRLLDGLPRLEVIGFNGATAARLGLKSLGEHAARYRIVPLPSSSPAHASMTLEHKLERWLQLRHDNS